MKSLARRLLAPLVALLRYLSFHSNVHRFPQTPRNVFEIVWERAAQSSADYVEQHLSGAMVFERRERLWDFVLGKVARDGLFAEFGVFSGASINHFARILASRNARIYGFDSFEGLKEDWQGTELPKGSFDRGGILPDVLSNVTLVKGWFDQTVPAFLDGHPGKFAFIHFDADTYEATELLLGLLKDRMASGTIVIFDEYLGFPNWEMGEFRAWQAHVRLHGIPYEYLGFSNNQAAIRLT